MNSLFYVGIIVPTVITIALFLIFIYCWLLQRVRREVLTKKYDPHGTMRNLGMSMNPPLPPCLLEDVLLSDAGEDNVAYDVSRSPSTQQDWRGRALYHTYHDSGISAGLSPNQENEPGQGLVYRTCPDSGVSELSVLQPHHASTGCYQIDPVGQGRPQLQQVYQDQVYLDTSQQQKYQQQSSHVAQNQSQVKASIHLNDTVGCTNMDGYVAARTHHSPQNQPNTSLLAGYNQRHSSMHTPATPTVCTPQSSMPPLYHELNHDHNSPQNGQLSVHSDQSRMLDCWREQQGVNRGTKHHIPLNKVIMMSPTVNSHLNEPVTPNSAANLYDLPFPLTPPPSSSCATATAANIPKQFYRDSGVMDVGDSGVMDVGDSGVMDVGDSGVMDVGQPTVPGPERPDSPASHSSTTDSEDSGFRSSYCAANRKTVLGKQQHPLLKSLRKTKRTKNYGKASWKAWGNSQNKPAGVHQPLVTLNTGNLQHNIHNVPVIEHTLTCQAVIPSSLAVRQQRPDMSSRDDIVATSLDQVELAASNHSPSNTQQPAKRNCNHSPVSNIWAPQSSNDTEVSATQTIHLMDISPHTSSMYLQEVRACCQPQPLDHHALLQRGQGCPPGSTRQAAADSHLDTFSYSIV